MSQIQTDIGNEITPLRASASTAVTAGGTGDNTEIVGDIFDRAAYGTPLSLAIAIAFTTTLAAGKKLTIKSLKIEHDDDPALGAAANFYAPSDVDVAVDGGSGSTIKGCQKYVVNISGAKRYIRLKYTPDLNASGTDTANVAALLILGGSYKAPAA